MVDTTEEAGQFRCAGCYAELMFSPLQCPVCKADVTQPLHPPEHPESRISTETPANDTQQPLSPEPATERTPLLHNEHETPS